MQMISELRRRIVSDEPQAPIRKDLRLLILRRIETADPLSDGTKKSLVSAISALDTTARRKSTESPRSRLSSALLHLQLSMTDPSTRRDRREHPDEILDALSREMLRNAAQKLAS